MNSIHTYQSIRWSKCWVPTARRPAGNLTRRISTLRSHHLVCWLVLDPTMFEAAWLTMTGKYTQVCGFYQILKAKLIQIQIGSGPSSLRRNGLNTYECLFVSCFAIFPASLCIESHTWNDHVHWHAILILWDWILTKSHKSQLSRLVFFNVGALYREDGSIQCFPLFFSAYNRGIQCLLCSKNVRRIPRSFRFTFKDNFHILWASQVMGGSLTSKSATIRPSHAHRQTNWDPSSLLSMR